MPVKKKVNKKEVEAKSKASSRGRAKTMEKSNTKTKAASKKGTRVKTQRDEPVRVVNKISPPRIQSGDERKNRGRVIHQYNYMKAPGMMHDFQVGDKVEVYCDHEKGRERVRGWIAGIVVQVDNKMVAVQFRSNVYLTDGWMVPDRILWYSLSSEHIRGMQGKRAPKKEKVKVIPDY